MALYRLSGLEDCNCSVGRSAKKAKRIARRQERKKQGKGFFRKIGKGVVKVATTPARNAFLLLLRINAFNLAVKLKQAINRDWMKVKKFWNKVGGNYTILQKTVNKGSARKSAKLSGIGAAPPAVAVAIPIIISVNELLKELGIDTGQILKDVIQKGISSIRNDYDE